jgi:multicomponent Na+:H+ antiporter subunit B
MRRLAALALLAVLAVAFAFALAAIPFGKDKIEVGNYYIREGVRQTGATNIVTSVVVGYRGLDTLGEVTVLFVAALGVGLLLSGGRTKGQRETIPSSVIVATGSRLLFPLILLFGIYIVLHGHLTPGGGFQGGAVIASGFLFLYLARPEQTVSRVEFRFGESLGGLIFVALGLLGIAYSGYFLDNFLPKGNSNALVSGGTIPLIYIAIGAKVGSELARIIGDLMERD